MFLTTYELTTDHDLNWEYDDDFNFVGITLDDTFSTSYAYDDDGAMVFAGDLALNRDATTGFLTNTVVGNVADSRSFNGFGEISGYAASSSNSPLYSATYTRDALGRVASQTEMLGAATTEKVYDYDVRGRLVSVKTDGIVTEWYAYDLNGNRTNSMNGAAVYDAQDRMTAGVGMTFTYDLNGSQTNRIVNGQNTGMAYDLFGQLKSVTLPDDRVVSYDRDALSRITAKRVDGIKVKGWIYKDALKPIAETDADGNVVSFFVYGTSGLSPDIMIRDGITYRFIRDVQGSVRLVVDTATGTIAQRLDYDSFGNVLLDTAPGFQPFGFQSGLYDPDTALVQFGARWYDAESGRWLSKDPILLEGGYNLYVFCGNDPVNFADPLGLCESDAAYIVVGSGFGAQSAANMVMSELQAAGWTTTQVTDVPFASLASDTHVNGLVLAGHGDGISAAGVDAWIVANFLTRTRQQLDLCVVLSCHGNQFVNSLFDDGVISDSALNISYWGYSRPAPVRNALMRREIRDWNANRGFRDVTYGNLIQDMVGIFVFDGIYKPVGRALNWVSGN